MAKKTITTNSDTEFKCSWKNCAVWASITGVAALAIRLLSWYFMIYMGSVDVFSDYFCNMSLWVLIASMVFPVIFYIISYSNYMRLAARYPHQLQEIESGSLGKPWQAPFFILLLADLVWAIVSSVLVILSCELEPFAIQDDARVLLTFLGIHGIDLATDLLLFFLGKQLFKPDHIQSH